jgi:hypothetical protein
VAEIGELRKLFSPQIYSKVEAFIRKEFEESSPKNPLSVKFLKFRLADNLL